MRIQRRLVLIVPLLGLLITLFSASAAAGETLRPPLQNNPTIAGSVANDGALLKNPDKISPVNLPANQLADPAPWPMVAANPQRTSWTPEEVSGSLQIQWYRPIEAYIPQNSQIIASYGLLYLATARGLYALNAASGALVWRYDTELPLGNSPTVAEGVVYVGGYDRKLHVLDALTGTHLWAFSGAKAGFDANPLVVEGKVIVGNRDGAMYAIGAHGTPNQGQQLWKFQTDGPIHLSAAYKDGIVYFAANDNYAYALQASTGNQVWKSNKLPGEQFQSYWPVIYQDKVIFSTAFSYRTGLRPGTRSVADTDGVGYGNYREMQLDDIFPGASEGTLLGPQVAPQAWAHGYPVINASRVTQYLENNPTSHPHQHKPWRRALVVLNRNDGSEYTFDSDRDGHREYIPIVWWGTNSGNRYPPLVGPDDILYQSNLYQCCSDAKGRVMGWNSTSPAYLSVLGGFGAVAEPQAISAGGNIIYRNLCCDRVGDWFNLTNPNSGGTVWSYDLSSLAPGYDQAWTIVPSWPRLQGWYKGNSNSINAAYHNHGDQNPIIPYQDRLYVHRSNAIIAFGAGSGPGRLPLLQIQAVQDDIVPLSRDDLKARLEQEIQKILNAGHLRPGYYNPGQAMVNYNWFGTYFDNPGDTLYTLSLAYPHLSSQLQAQLNSYLRQEFQDYFDSNMYATIGWANGAAREAMDLPPEVQADLVNHPPRFTPSGFSWSYPPHNFYAMWKYAEIFPQDAPRAYDLAKTKLQVPVPSLATTDYFRQEPYELNAYIAGYIGFLQLQDLADKASSDSQLRTRVTTELNRLLQLRVSIFTKDSYWPGEDRFHKKHFDIARNFLFLTPELGNYLAQTIPGPIQTAINEYNYVAPYWFVSRYEAVIGEGVMAHLYNYSALFQAKGLILQESPNELAKYLDVPAFAVGDLFYIQNLATILGTPGFSFNVTPISYTVDPGGSGTYTINIQHRGDFTSTVTLAAINPSPADGLLNIQLSRSSVDFPGGQATLTLTDLHDASFTDSVWYTMSLVANGGNISQTIRINLLVNGWQTSLPIILK
ncbi:MAG: PQQ-like beta-propeller repeat protein [Anaerolineae bacterium]|nr:PQQ-like beta-propeller repeat protein [Anaerolineae bacterium]